MSIPKRHHYVSRCLIENFFDDSGKIYYYDKTNDNFCDTITSKNLFFEKELNSKVKDDGTVDHEEIEAVLNNSFEKDFPAHYNKILKLVTEKDKALVIKSFESGELTESILYLLQMAIVGDMRTPRNKTKAADSIFGVFKMLSENAVDKLKKEFEELERKHSKVAYPVSLDYKEMSDEILKGMGESVYSIFIAPENECFLLPDCSSIHRRAQLVPDSFVDGKRCTNPAREIALVGMPINSKVFIMLESLKVSKCKFNRIQKITNQDVLNLNKWLYSSSYNRIACENNMYLNQFISQL